MTQDAFKVPTPGSKSRQVFDLIVQDGMSPCQAATKVGVATQTAERVVERYVNHNKLVLARERVADLEAELNTLKGTARG